MLTAEERMELGVLRKHGAGIRELARVTGWSRNTVRRYLREGDAAAVRKAAPKRAEKLDPFKAYIVDRVKAAAPDRNRCGPNTIQLDLLQGLAERNVFCVGKSTVTLTIRRSYNSMDRIVGSHPVTYRVGENRAQEPHCAIGCAFATSHPRHSPRLGLQGGRRLALGDIVHENLNVLAGDGRDPELAQ